MFSRKDINSICEAYSINCNNIGKLIDTSKGIYDKRFNYEINNTYFLKITNSKAISENILKDIHKLIIRYNSIGVYCPLLIKNSLNMFTYSIKKDKEVFICWIEEKAIHKICEDSFEDVYELKKQIVKHLGIFASYFTNVDLSDSRSMWSIIELSPYDNEIDEKQENFDDLVSALKLNKLDEISDNLIYMNKESRKRIKAIMPKLPRCVFQGDLNTSNILLDSKDKFAGLIDFNMFGTEVNINCFLNEAMYYITKEDFDKLSGHEIFLKTKDRQSELLNIIFENYEMNSSELEIYSDYNKIIFSSFYPNVVLLVDLLTKWKHVDKIVEYLNLIHSL